MKPISTLLKGLPSIDLNTKQPEMSQYERSDICAVSAASVVMESVVAFEIARAALDKFGGDTLMELEDNYANYLKNTFDYLEAMDVISGLVKAGVFGFIIALMGCYHGYNSKGGAQGVGAATTNAVVSAAILILAANYFMTSLFFHR